MYLRGDPVGLSVGGLAVIDKNFGLSVSRFSFYLHILFNSCSGKYVLSTSSAVHDV